MIVHYLFLKSVYFSSISYFSKYNLSHWQKENVLFQCKMAVKTINRSFMYFFNS